MKPLLTIFLLFLCVSAFSQYNAHPSVQDTCVDKKLSVVCYIFLKENGAPVVPPIFMDTLFGRLNKVFSRVCITFMNCSTVYIPIYTFGGWHPRVTEFNVKSQWYTENTLNFYVVDTLYQNGGITELFAYSYEPTSLNIGVKRDLVVIEGSSMLLYSSSSVFHALGTYFGLNHTYAEINPGTPASPPPPTGIISHEFASQTKPNCELHGDGLCDTEADPGLMCNCVDGNGLMYVPPKDNFMSHYMKFRVRYTAMQYHKIVYGLITKRLYLH